MGEGLFQPLHLLLIGAIALIVFGPKKLPELGKGLGEAIRGFRTSLRESDEDTPQGPPASPRDTTDRRS